MCFSNVMVKCVCMLGEVLPARVHDLLLVRGCPGDNRVFGYHSERLMVVNGARGTGSLRGRDEDDDLVVLVVDHHGLEAFEHRGRGSRMVDEDDGKDTGPRDTRGGHPGGRQSAALIRLA